MSDRELHPDGRKRLHACLRSPSGEAVMSTLAGSDKPMTARQIAEAAFVSTTSARDQAARAVRLGYAVQTTVPVHGMPARAWQMTGAGRDYMVGDRS